MLCLLLRRKKNFFLYIYEVITWGKIPKRANIDYSSHPFRALGRAC